MKTFRAIIFCFAGSVAGAQETPVDPYPPPIKPSGRLVLSTKNREAAQATNACATALEAGDPTRAKEKCEEALKHDPQVALTHLHMAQALAELNDNAAAHAELSRAGELSAHASHGERLFIDAYRARRDAKINEAERLYDELCSTLPGEPRARLARGDFFLARGQIDRAIADFHSIPAIAPRFGVVDRFLAKALTASAPSAAEEAVAVAKRYTAAAPTEASAEVAVGYAELRRGNAAEAIAAAKRALERDAKNISAELLLADAQLFSNHAKEAHLLYQAIAQSKLEPARERATLHEAHALIAEGKLAAAEKLLGEAAKAASPTAAARALTERARLELDRSALSDAGQSLRQARALVDKSESTAFFEDERLYTLGEIEYVRALVLGATGETDLANQRAQEMGSLLQALGDKHSEAKVTALAGWIAARNGDDKMALQKLPGAGRPTQKMAFALALYRAGDDKQARTIMEELAHRLQDDLEGALTRPRALAWLKKQSK